MRFEIARKYVTDLLATKSPKIIPKGGWDKKRYLDSLSSTYEDRKKWLRSGLSSRAAQHASLGADRIEHGLRAGALRLRERPSD